MGVLVPRRWCVVYKIGQKNAVVPENNRPAPPCFLFFISGAPCIDGDGDGGPSFF
jgi:hypothetical protein